jgi:hypothetical protein
MTDEYLPAAESNVTMDGEDTETVISNKGIKLKEKCVLKYCFLIELFR